LAVYANLSEARREADRRIKAGAGIRVHSTTFAEWDPPDDLSRLNSPDSDDPSEALRRGKVRTSSPNGENGHSATWREGANFELAGIEDSERIAFLSSTNCEACHQELRPREIVDKSHSEWFVVDVFCRHCDRSTLARIRRESNGR